MQDYPLKNIDNKYNHPHKETIDNLTYNKTEIYRTDLQGTVIASTDGENITFKTKK